MSVMDICFGVPPLAFEKPPIAPLEKIFCRRNWMGRHHFAGKKNWHALKNMINIGFKAAYSNFKNRFLKLLQVT